MAEADTDPPPSSRDVAGEDFLFHLYRGSELLQDNNVHEAKQELEQALGLQPRDPKGQDLLAIVYFRLGLYPRAIAIYEELIEFYPEATTPRINLALCYLKTGQPGRSRTVLEQVVGRDPSHTRAWGYLGLSFQRLGDLERAVHSFEMGGHSSMAKRLVELSTPHAPVRAHPASNSAEREALTETMTAAYDEIDHREFRPASGTDPLSSSGSWMAVEPGRLVEPESRSLWPAATPLPSESLPPPGFGVSPAPPVAVIPSAPRPAALDVQAPVARDPGPREIPPSPTLPPARFERAEPMVSMLRASLLVFPKEPSAATHQSGLVLAHSPRWALARMDAVRAVRCNSQHSARPEPRRSRGAALQESLGGSQPLLRFEDGVELVLAAPSGSKLIPVDLGAEELVVRESCLVALLGGCEHETAKIPGTDGEAITMVRLRGPGHAVLALPPTFASLELAENRGTTLRSASLLGWTGRLTLRTLSLSEAPAQGRGFLSVQGLGMVLVDGR